MVTGKGHFKTLFEQLFCFCAENRHILKGTQRFSLRVGGKTIEQGWGAFSVVMAVKSITKACVREQIVVIGVITGPQDLIPVVTWQSAELPVMIYGLISTTRNSPIIVRTGAIITKS